MPSFPDVDSHIRTVFSDEVAYTATPLAAGAEYVSSAVDGSLARRLVGFVFADQPGTLHVEFSRDAWTWRSVFQQTVSGGQAVGFDVPFYGMYARIRYVNGATAQGAFELYARRSVM